MQWRIAGLLGALLLIAAAPSRSGGGERTLTIANRADQPINEVYASPSGIDDWGADWLGEATIEPRQQRRIALGQANPRDCLYDLQIVYADASREERRGVDLCRSRSVTFDATAAVPPPGAEGGDHAVLIANESGLPIQQVLVSPAEAGEWGEDRLGQDSLSVGDVASVAYRGGCLADLRVIFENRAAEERRGLDLCDLGGVTIAPGWTTAVSLTPRRATGASAALVRLDVTVVNQSGRAIRELYLFPETSASSGPDRLAATPLEDGARITVEVLRPPGSCRYGATIVYGGKTANQNIPGLDLCKAPTIVVPPRT